jgi:hypothetical protein
MPTTRARRAMGRRAWSARCRPGSSATRRGVCPRRPALVWPEASWVPPRRPFFLVSDGAAECGVETRANASEGPGRNAAARRPVPVFELSEGDGPPGSAPRRRGDTLLGALADAEAGAVPREVVQRVFGSPAAGASGHGGDGVGPAHGLEAQPDRVRASEKAGSGGASRIGGRRLELAVVDQKRRQT